MGITQTISAVMHNPEPIGVVDDILRILQRANATTREVRLLLALIRNLKGWP